MNTTPPSSPNPQPSLHLPLPTTISLTSILFSSFLKRSDSDALTNLSPRGPSDFPGKAPTTWCAPNCKTYIRVIYVSEIAAGKTDWNTIRTYLSNAQYVCALSINMGDKFIPHGAWLYGHNFKNTFNLELHFQNSNNHQLTWGVNRAALVALADYFDALEKLGVNPGAVSFTIVDGENEVADGVFGVQGQWTG